MQVPITLSAPASEEVTVDWETFPYAGEALATSGVDYAPGSGTVTIPAGELTGYAPVTIYGDTLDEYAILGGEFLFVRFSNPSPNATLDTSFFGLGAYVIQDVDPPPAIVPGTATITEGDTGTSVVPSRSASPPPRARPSPSTGRPRHSGPPPPTMISSSTTGSSPSTQATPPPPSTSPSSATPTPKQTKRSSRRSPTRTTPPSAATTDSVSPPSPTTTSNRRRQHLASPQHDHGAGRRWLVALPALTIRDRPRS